MVHRTLVTNCLDGSMRRCNLLGIARRKRGFLGGPGSFGVARSGSFRRIRRRMPTHNNNSYTMSPTLCSVLGSLEGGLSGGLRIPPCMVFRSPSLRTVTAVCPMALRRLRGVPNMNTKGTGHCNRRFYGLVGHRYRRGRVRHPRSLHMHAITGGSGVGISVVRTVSHGMTLSSVTLSGNVRFKRLLSRMRTVICSKAGLGVSCFLRRVVSRSRLLSVCSCFGRSAASGVSSTLSRLKSSFARRRIHLMHVGFVSRVTGWGGQGG